MSQLGTKIFDEHHGSTIEEWQGAMLRAAESSDPSFPNFRHLARLGSLNLATGIEEAFKLYKIARPHLDKCVGPQKNYLDFGCGVGRIFKTFMRDFPAQNMTGADVTEEFIDFCKEDFASEFNFTHIPMRPKTQISSNSIDVITAYSVFSHFSAIQATRWLDEFDRICRSGATLILTTYGRGHLDYVADTDPSELPPNKITQQKDINDAGGKSEFIRMFELGEMLFYARNPAFGFYDYGHAYVGEEFVRRIWGKNFEIVEVVDDYDKLEQMAVVLRKL